MKNEREKMREEFDRLSKSVIVGAVMIIAAGAGLVGFVCWAIWRVVSHLTGAS